MAQYYFGINRGQYPQEAVFTNGTTNSTDIEIRIDTTKKLNDQDRSQAMEVLRRIIENPNLSGLVFPGWYDDNT